MTFLRNKKRVNEAKRSEYVKNAEKVHVDRYKKLTFRYVLSSYLLQIKNVRTFFVL